MSAGKDPKVLDKEHLIILAMVTRTGGVKPSDLNQIATLEITGYINKEGQFDILIESDSNAAAAVNRDAVSAVEGHPCASILKW
jgi:hypothetical protein